MVGEFLEIGVERRQERLVLRRKLDSASAPRLTQDWPSEAILGLPASSKVACASASTCSGVSSRAPIRSNSDTSSS